MLDGRRPLEVTTAEADSAARSAGLARTPRRRLRHVVSENERVRRVVAALESPGGADRAALGESFAAGHASLRDDFEVSLPELDLLVELAVEAGAVGARLTGGGFGGAIVALVDEDRVETLAGIVRDGYRVRAGREATVSRCVAVDGAGETA